MIRTGNPALDAAEIENRVRTAVANVGALPEREPSVDGDAALGKRIRYVRELLTDVDARLALSAERSAPRADVPPRFAKFGPAGAILVRAINYAFKSQRESDDHLRAAVRGATAALSALADLVEGHR